MSKCQKTLGTFMPCSPPQRLLLLYQCLLPPVPPHLSRKAFLLDPKRVLRVQRHAPARLQPRGAAGRVGARAAAARTPCRSTRPAGMTVPEANPLNRQSCERDSGHPPASPRSGAGELRCPLPKDPSMEALSFQSGFSSRFTHIPGHRGKRF